MPFFMYLSGFVFFLIGAQTVRGAAWGEYLQRRAVRLLLPFVLFAVFIITGKYLAGFLMYVQDRPDGYWAGYYHVLWQTEQSPVLSIWYVLVLFVYSIGTPLLWRLTGGRVLLLLALGLFLHLGLVSGWLPISDDFYLDRIARFYVFFMAGGVMAVYRTRLLPLLDKAVWVSLALFAASMVWFGNSVFTMFVVGGLSMFALHGLVRLPLFANDKLLYFIGRNSMVIYLFNTIFIGAAKGVYLWVLPYQGPWVFALLAVTFVAGLWLPIMFKKGVDRVPALRPLGRIIA
jgi:fucose 4-O-acetylase-like acetyltransferase